MRTIIQHIGPLYGELNTGTVFGQPNGSIAVSQNLVPTPEPSSKDEVTIWNLSYFKSVGTTYGTAKYFKMTGSTTLKFSVTVDGSKYTSGYICEKELLQSITDTNTVTRFEMATDESFSDIIFTGNLATDESTNLKTSFTNVTAPSLTADTEYYIRILLYSSGGTYLYKKSNVLAMTYISG